MSEDEIVSLQELQYSVENFGSFDIGDFNYDSLKTVLVYVEKQQKEIEDLKEDFNKANNIAIKNMTEYISKQKIKDKIKEITKYGNTRYVEELSYKMKNGNWINKRLAKELLQELLKEE